MDYESYINYPFPCLTYCNQFGSKYEWAFLCFLGSYYIANNLPLPQAVNPSLVWNEAEFNTQLTLYSVFVVHNLRSEKMNIGVLNGNLISTYLKLWL